MIKATHICIASALTINLIMKNPISAIGLMGSTLPDVDLLIGIPHRTFTHSLVFTSIVCFIILLVNKEIGVIFGMSILSHLAADSTTKMGVPLFYPFNKKYYGFRRFKTGSSEDYIIGVLAVSYIAWVLR